MFKSDDSSEPTLRGVEARVSDGCSKIFLGEAAMLEAEDCSGMIFAGVETSEMG